MSAKPRVVVFVDLFGKEANSAAAQFGLESCFFFLTHFHKDHMKGLGKKTMPSKLYCSKITSRELLATFGKSIEKHLVIVKNKVDVLSLGFSGYQTRIIPLDSNHLQGSFMLLFLRAKGERIILRDTHGTSAVIPSRGRTRPRRILYTGDYRFVADMIPTIRSITTKPISMLFVDGTFHHKDRKMASEKTSEKEFEKWFDKLLPLDQNIVGKGHHVLFGVSHVGQCALLSKLNKACKTGKYSFFLHHSIKEPLRSRIFRFYPKDVRKKPESCNFILVSPHSPDVVDICTKGNAVLKKTCEHREGKKKYIINVKAGIIASSLWYGCESSVSNYPNPSIPTHIKKSGFYRINFTAHSDYIDNMYLAHQIGAVEIQVLGEPRVGMKCRV